jgi:polyphenol oxidase
VTDAVEETLDEGGLPVWRHPGWRERFPWLTQGTTGSGEGEPFDLGLFGSAPAGDVVGRWRTLREVTGFSTALHSRQVHEAEIGRWEAPLPAGLVLTEGQDAHVATVPDVLLAVSIADCVPVFLVEPEGRGVALIHAGWRGVAADILERSVEALEAASGAGAGTLWLHCGPAICGECYEVGIEVHEAIHPDREPPRGPTPIDLRAAIVERAVRLGVEPGRCTISRHCSRCGPGAFFSHRAGSPARQVGILGIRR